MSKVVKKVVSICVPITLATLLISTATANSETKKLTAKELKGNFLQKQPIDKLKKLKIDEYKSNLKLLQVEAKRSSKIKKLINVYTPEKSEIVDKEGNFEVTILNNKRKKQKYILLGKKSAYAAISESIKASKSKDKQLELYKFIYNSIPKELDKKVSANILAPQNIKSKKLAEIKSKIKAFPFSVIIAQNLANIVANPPANRPLTCNDEYGAGDGTDRYIFRGMDNAYGVQQQGAHHPDSLFSKQNFPLKWYTTCTKNQSRGMCPAFSTMAALEAGIAYKTHRWVNLSEQSAWAQAIFFGRGDSTIKTLTINQSRIPYEYGWDYNPSKMICNDHGTNGHSICPPRELGKYEDACRGYNAENCSETKHQAKWVYHCGSTGECRLTWSIGPSSPAEHKIKQIVDIWDNNQLDTSLLIAELAGSVGAPVVASLYAHNTGFHHDGSPTGCINQAGFLRYDQSCKNKIESINEAPGGRHMVFVAATISNSRLANGIPNGEGGGYVVIKNSWGVSFGDQGWVYVPFAWAKKYLYNMQVLTSYE